MFTKRFFSLMLGLLMSLAIVPASQAEMGFMLNDHCAKPDRMERRYHTYQRSAYPHPGFGVRLAWTEPLGNWNDMPDSYGAVNMFGGGLGFDIDAGMWYRDAGYFLVLGGNSFDMGDYEQYVMDQGDDEVISANAHMMYLRTEVKGKLNRSGDMLPLVKAGVGYYFFGGEEKYRSPNGMHYYTNYGDEFFNNNFGINLGGELAFKTSGPAIVVSVDWIYVFDAVMNTDSYEFDHEDQYKGLSQIKIGVGVGF